MVAELVAALQILFLVYFLGLNGVYIMLNLLAIPVLVRTMRERSLEDLPYVHAGFEPPVSILAPAYNEETTIAATVRSLLQLVYPEYEIIVVNDGAKDRTLEVLIREFDLLAVPETYRIQVETQPVRNIYQSVTYPNLRVVDKANGGKSDALNAGINCARYPLFCCIDADSILQRDSLKRVVQPFLDDPTTVVSGGTIRVANGCDIQGGFLTRAGLPKHPLALIQIVEYLRAFLFGRMGWTPLNAVLIISGAFGVFDKKTVVEIGGYRADTIGEDMELIVRMHRILREQGRPYRIAFVPDPICWTDAPEDLKTLRNQRIRWQRGLSDSLMLNRGLLFHPRGGTPGWIAFPFMLFFELWGPIIEVAGYLFMIVGLIFGFVSTEAWGAFLVVAVGLGILLSTSSLLLEEVSFHMYPRLGHILTLAFVSVLENVVYRQLITIWRLTGMVQIITKQKATWGKMVRTSSWNQNQ